jgi:hypothetical protein
VRKSHIASLGSVPTPASVDDRIAFWQALHECMARLANRVDAATQAKVFGSIHERVPMVVVDEQRAVQLRNAEADERFWSGMRDNNQATIDDHRRLIAAAERAIAVAEQARAAAAAEATAAKDRVDRIKRGEDVPGGLGKPLTYEDMNRMLLEQGFTTSDLRHMELLGTLSEAELKDELLPEILKAHKRAERALVRAFVRRRDRAPGDE